MPTSSSIIYCIISIVTIVASYIYPGHAYIYILFSIVFNILLFMGFRRKRIFFDTFIGIFFWLGFWMKYTFVLLFCEYRFIEATGNFDYSGFASDNALWVCIIGAAGLIIASYLREKWCHEIYPKNVGENYLGIFYRKHRSTVLGTFVSFVIIIAAANIWLGMYQRGLSAQTILPFGLNGVYTWLLLFGLTSISAIVIEAELRNRRDIYVVAIISMFETFCSSVSILSRAMIINTSALFFGAAEIDRNRDCRMTYKFKMVIFVVFIFMFIGSIFTVSIIRERKFSLDSNAIHETSVGSKISYVARIAHKLLVNRWVGIEGVLAISSYGNLGNDLWKEAWREKYSDYGTSIYDLNIAKSGYETMHSKKHHFITVPGIVGFFYYQGSLAVLFISMVFLGILAAAIEMVVYKLGGGNMILCSLIGQVVAYRYAHFGYVPGQSYLLFGAIIMNIGIIYLVNRVCGYYAKRNGHIDVPVKRAFEK